MLEDEWPENVAHLQGHEALELGRVHLPIVYHEDGVLTHAHHRLIIRHLITTTLHFPILQKPPAEKAVIFGPVVDGYRLEGGLIRLKLIRPE